MCVGMEKCLDCEKKSKLLEMIKDAKSGLAALCDRYFNAAAIANNNISNHKTVRRATNVLESELEYALHELKKLDCKKTKEE